MTNSVNHPLYMAIDPAGEILAMSSRHEFSLWQYGAEAPYFSSKDFASSNLSFSPDGERIAIFSRNSSDELIFVDPVTGAVQEKFELPEVSKIAFTQDRDYFAFSGTNNGMIHLWDVHHGEMLYTLLGHNHLQEDDILGFAFSYINDLAFSADGRILASVEKNQLRFWDVETGDFLAELTSKFSIHEIAFSPDGHYMATAGNDGTIRIWAIVEQQ